MPIEEFFTPTTAEVAVNIKNRTVDENNNFVGDFDDTTIVKVSEVETIIQMAGPMVLAALRWDPTAEEPTIPEDNYPAVKSLIALYSAIVVEVTKFSEQIARQVSPYPYLKELFDGMLGQKQGELGIIPPKTSGSLTLVDLIAAQFGQAIYSFPDDPMVNWNTAF